jgi:hypothetical protein
MLHIFFLGVLFGQTTGTSVQRPSAPAPSELKVVIAAPIYQPDGGVTAETTTLPASAPNVVHIFSRKSVCETAIAGGAEPNDAAFGWRLASQTLSVTDSIVNVSVEWRRVWDRGRKLMNGPSGTVQLKLHPGARIPLDHIPNPAPTDTCRAVGLGLEIRLARTAPTPPVNSALVPLGASAGGASSIDADLWLVQRTPSGAEQAQHQTVRLDKRGGSFTFAPVKVSGDRGEVDVEILGSFERYRAPVGGEYVYFTLQRSITGESMPPGGFRSGTGTMIQLPGPEEVLALEIPGPGGAQGGRGGMVSARARGGGARSRGAGGAASDPPARTDPTVAQGAGAMARRGGGGGDTGAASAGPAAGSTLSPQAIEILKGHAFSLRLKFTPVPGS